MRRLTLLKIILISLLGSSLLCLLAFYSLRTIEANSGLTRQQELAVRIARDFESSPIPEAMQTYVQRHSRGATGLRTQIWAVDENGTLLGATTEEPLPFEWSDRCKPAAPHEIAVRYAFLSLTPDFTCIRLEKDDPAYLIIHLVPRRSPSAVLGTSFLFIFLTVAVAVFLALTLNFFYLQRKSREAKEVLARIQSGDLEARFQIQQFDEIGSLMLDFNHMADALQGLVLRVREVENSRRHLLQELSHDIRTPLTSLKTSLETLRQSHPQMSPADREEFFGLVDAELNYLVRLLEDLFFIADLDEPRFKASAEEVDLLELLKTEIRNRQQQQPNLRWVWKMEPKEPAMIIGDPHLIRRLFKNALDNASRFAKSQILLNLEAEQNFWDLQIEDDGPGLSEQALENFGKRRQTRMAPPAGTSHLSLGLGSVIMKSIADLHSGSIEIQNLLGDQKVRGARQQIRLHKSMRAKSPSQN